MLVLAVSTSLLFFIRKIGYRFVPKESDSCMIPEGEFKAWECGLVTKLIPEIKKDCNKLSDGDMSEVKRWIGI